MARLAGLFEQSALLRDRARTQGKLCSWPSPALTGVGGMSTLLANLEATEILACWWCPLSNKAAPVSIDILRQEAWMLKIANLWYWISDEPANPQLCFWDKSNW